MSEQFEDQVDIRINGVSTIRLESANATATLGGGDQSEGDLILLDSSDATRVHVSANGQRIEMRDDSGNIISMMGGEGDIRADSNDESGSLYLYPNDVGNIFNNSEESCLPAIREASKKWTMPIRNWKMVLNRF